MNTLVCIHKYLTKCNTKGQPPGFADFLRGTIALYNYSKKYGYTLYIDKNSHPIFTYFASCNHYTESIYTNDVHELIDSIPYSIIDLKLKALFESNISFSVFTNSFYTNENNTLVNFGDITSDCREYIMSILNPIPSICDKVYRIQDTIFKTRDYKVMHIRFGDEYIHHFRDCNIRLYLSLVQTISILMKDKPYIYVLLTDSSVIGNKLMADIPGLHYWDNNKVHTGDLINGSYKIEDTLIDFLILSKSKEVIYLKSDFSVSGFSKLASIIYNIPYTYIDPQDIHLV